MFGNLLIRFLLFPAFWINHSEFDENYLMAFLRTHSYQWLILNHYYFILFFLNISLFLNFFFIRYSFIEEIKNFCAFNFFMLEPKSYVLYFWWLFYNVFIISRKLFCIWLIVFHYLLPFNYSFIFLSCIFCLLFFPIVFFLIIAKYGNFVRRDYSFNNNNK